MPSDLYLTALVELQRRLLQGDPRTLEPLGQVSSASRVYIFENHRDAHGRLLTSQRAEWCAEGITPEIGNPLLQNLSYDEYLARWAEVLGRGEVISGTVADFPETERAVLEPQGIRSILIIPVMVAGEFFGFIGFDNCRQARPWEPAEVALLRAAAAAIAAFQERRQVEAALLQSEKKYRSVVESIKEVIFQLDAEGRWLFLNPAWSEITGFACEETRGRPFAEYLHPEDAAPVAEQFAALLAGTATVCRREARLLTAEGDFHWFEIDATAFDGGPNEAIGILGTLIDIGGSKQAAEALALARDRAIEASQLKSEFMAMISHEIRTPMNGIVGLTDLLLETDLNAEQHEYLTLLQSSAESLMKVITDVLDFSKIESGTMRIETVSFLVPEVVQTVVDLFRMPATKKGLEICVRLDNRLRNFPVQGDPDRLRQVLLNLVGNAIKFTHLGRIEVAAALIEKPDGRTLLRCTVADTGIGISPEDLHRLFQPFTQLDGSTTRRYGGTGLGLSICRRLVELMGGTIGVESNPGRGSRFWFQLPAGG